MDEKAVAVITTIVVGFLGSTFLGALLNWPDAGAVCAIAAMVCFVLHAIEDGKKYTRCFLRRRDCNGFFTFCGWYAIVAPYRLERGCS